MIRIELMQVTLTYLMTIPLFESNDKLTLDDLTRFYKKLPIKAF